MRWVWAGGLIALGLAVAPISLASDELLHIGDNFVTLEAVGHQVSLSQLNAYVGKSLRFITREGQRYDGFLQRVEGGRAYIRARYGAGATEMFLRLEKIYRIQAYL